MLHLRLLSHLEEERQERVVFTSLYTAFRLQAVSYLIAIEGMDVALDEFLGLYSAPPGVRA